MTVQSCKAWSCPHFVSVSAKFSVDVNLCVKKCANFASVSATFSADVVVWVKCENCANFGSASWVQHSGRMWILIIFYGKYLRVHFTSKVLKNVPILWVWVQHSRWMCDTFTLQSVARRIKQPHATTCRQQQCNANVSSKCISRYRLLSIKRMCQPHATTRSQRCNSNVSVDVNYDASNNLMPRLVDISDIMQMY